MLEYFRLCREDNEEMPMIPRLLLAMIVAATFGLSACEKSDESTGEHMAPATGAVEHAEEGGAAMKEGTEEAAHQ
jgi:hypothetical protein